MEGRMKKLDPNLNETDALVDDLPVIVTLGAGKCW